MLYWLDCLIFFIYYYFFFQFISTLVLVCVERKSLVNASLRGQKGPFSCWLCSVTIITKNLRNLDIGVGRENKNKNKKRAIGIIKIKYHFLGVMATLCTLVSRNYGVPTRSNWYFYLWEKKKNNHLHLIVVISFFFFWLTRNLSSINCIQFPLKFEFLFSFSSFFFDFLLSFLSPYLYLFYSYLSHIPHYGYYHNV